MTISYKWLSEYLPLSVDPERLSKILTSVGLEVEGMHAYQEVKGNLEGLKIGEVISVEKHPQADKLSLTQVNIGENENLQIVCGAPNVAAGQKVVVAPVGSTIYPSNGEPITMKVAKIRGIESYGMICAEDEIGLGASHDGILVLPDSAEPGTTATAYFAPYNDVVFEIGLTPNRMDAMSHWGVARDVCAYISHHDNKAIKPILPNTNGVKPEAEKPAIKVSIVNADECPRYSALLLTDIKIGPSPKWMQQRLNAIGIRPINNIVDITNYIQHETGQPLHAFDADYIGNSEIVVTALEAGTSFTTLDEKERKLLATDIMITKKENDVLVPMCIAGVFGGVLSGVTENTKNVILESACFHPVSIRKTSFSHGLRTDAASRFEKGTDVSNTVNVLKRAALLTQEIAGGKIGSSIADEYPGKKEKTEVSLKYHYLKKLSGKNYHTDSIKDILGSLGFEILKEGIDEIRVAVPFHKPDIAIPADIVEEILRIDGLDNIDIPGSITISPALQTNFAGETIFEKVCGSLVSKGFLEIITNSITDDKFYTQEEAKGLVKLINSLSQDLNTLRPSLLETSLQCVAYNLNRKNNSLQLFEIGKVYQQVNVGKYEEKNHLALVLSGQARPQQWNEKPKDFDFYSLKAYCQSVLRMMGIEKVFFTPSTSAKYTTYVEVKSGSKVIGHIGSVQKNLLHKFGIKQEVFFCALCWDDLLALQAGITKNIQALPKFPSVSRDLALVVKKEVVFAEIEKTIQALRITQLISTQLFDLYKGEKLGEGLQSLAVRFQFSDSTKTLTDKEIEGWMVKIMGALEKNVGADIRK